MRKSVCTLGPFIKGQKLNIQNNKYQIEFLTGDIVDEKTQGLVCSGNVQLNMSGGVNGELLSRGGINMQKQLHDYLQTQKLNYVEPGFTMRIGTEPFHFKSIIYTVAVNAFYDTSIEIVKESLCNALKLLQQDQCESISIPALATGYGHLSKNDFGIALKQTLKNQNWNFRKIRIVLNDEQDLQEVKQGYNKIL